MRRGLTYTGRALADLAQVRDWLTQAGSGERSRRRIVAIRTAIRRLKNHPCLYAAGEHAGVRELPCAGGYRVLYAVHPDTGDSTTTGDVLILRLFGPGQDRTHP